MIQYNIRVTQSDSERLSMHIRVTYSDVGEQERDTSKSVLNLSTYESVSLKLKHV